MSPLHEKLDQVEWGEWRLGDLFEFEAIKQAKSQKLIPTDGTNNGVPYIVQSNFNNMFSRNVNKQRLIDNNEAPVSGNRIVLGVTLPAVSYQPKEFGASQVITAKAEWLNTKNAMYITSAISKLMYQFGYDRKPGLQIYKDMKIHLPTKSGEIDFAFMENFIGDVENEYINDLETDHKQELHAYLSVTGFADYALTDEEDRVLEEFESGKVRWGGFTLGAEKGLFDVVGTKSLDSNAIDFVGEGINFVGRTFEDNGIQGKIEKQSFEPNEPMTITATVIGNYKYAKLQREPYYCSQNINKLTPNATIAKWNKQIAYYFVANIQKFVSLYDGQQGGYKLDDIKNHTVYIPTLNNQPDYDVMQTLISAVQKIVIGEVVEYASRKITTIKKVIDK